MVIIYGVKGEGGGALSVKRGSLGSSWDTLGARRDSLGAGGGKPTARG